MKLLKNKRAWLKWEKTVSNGGGAVHHEEPTEYPCFAYATVGSFAYEEESVNYLYQDDIQRMNREMSV